MGEARNNPTLSDHAVVVDDRDNVAVIKFGLAAGTDLTLDDGTVITVQGQPTAGHRFAKLGPVGNQVCKGRGADGRGHDNGSCEGENPQQERERKILHQEVSFGLCARPRSARWRR